MELDFASKESIYNEYESKFYNLASITLKHLNLSFNPIISVSIVNNRYIHKINLKYRGIDRPTDVISFAFLDNDPNRESLKKSNAQVALGDIYISYEKAIEQAQAYGHSLEREMCFLFVHGLLHLLGYDHMNQDDEKIMFNLQEEILAQR